MDVKFSELLEEPIRSGISRPSRTRGHGVPMINMREIFAFDFIRDGEADLVPVDEGELKKFGLHEGDLLFARQSLSWDGAGKVSIVEALATPTVFESHLLRARVCSEVASPQFLYYFFKAGPGRRAVEGIIQQVAAAGIRSKELANLLLRLPGVEEQRSIAEVLDFFDRKIAANRAATESADRLVRALYGRLQPSNRTFDQIAVNIRESVASNDIAIDELYVGLEHLDRRSLWLDGRGVGADVASSKSRFAAGDVLFGKLRPYFHKVALAPSAGVCSTDILVLRAREPRHIALVAAGASSDEVVAAAVQASNGTKMPRAKWADIATCSVPDPDSADVREFCAVVDPLAERAARAVEENLRLAATRDELLPLLMSGKITVKDAEKTVEEVV
jgi:type I restriction enzyme, S subunit